MTQANGTQVWKDTLETHKAYLGMQVSDVLDSLEELHGENHEELVADAISQLNASNGDGLKGDAATNWYTGSASLGGFIRGTLDSSIYFGSHGNYRFSGSMWSGPAAVTGGGGGAWSMIPRNGQEMGFAYWGASSGGGAVNILWNINGTVVGSMAIAVAGVGIGGGSGSGKWTKGN